jgi:Nuclease-related domain
VRSGIRMNFRNQERDADRHLMSSTAGHFAKQQLIARRRDFLRKHWWRIAILVAMLLVVGAGLYWVFPTAQIPIWAALPSLFLGFLFFGRELFDGTYHLVNAIEAEGLTSKDLRRWLGKDWHVVDWISFEFHDVDHVVVGPGGVLAVETKSTDSRLDLGSGRGKTRTLEWIGQATEGSRSVRSLLSSFGYRLRVSPVVVVWGSAISGTPPNGDVPVIRPKELEAQVAGWRNAPRQLTREQVDDIHANLLEYRSMRERHELGRRNSLA